AVGAGGALIWWPRPGGGTPDRVVPTAGPDGPHTDGPHESPKPFSDPLPGAWVRRPARLEGVQSWTIEAVLPIQLAGCRDNDDGSLTVALYRAGNVTLPHQRFDLDDLKILDEPFGGLYWHLAPSGDCCARSELSGQVSLLKNGGEGVQTKGV